MEWNQQIKKRDGNSLNKLSEKAADSEFKPFCSENVVSFLHLLHIYIQVHFRLDIFTETTNMNHDQTAWAVWSGPILFAI